MKDSWATGQLFQYGMGCRFARHWGCSAREIHPCMPSSWKDIWGAHM